MLPQPVRSKNAQCPYGSPLRCAGRVAGPDQWRAASLSQWYKLSADCVAHPPHKCQTPDASALLRHDPETLPSGNPVPIHKARDPARPEAGQRGRADFDERGSRARSRHGGGTGYQARNEVRWFQGRVWRLQQKHRWLDRAAHVAENSGRENRSAAELNFLRANASDRGALKSSQARISPESRAATRNQAP